MASVGVNRFFTCVADEFGDTAMRLSPDKVSLTAQMNERLGLRDGDIVKVKCSVLSGYRRVTNEEKAEYDIPPCAVVYDPVQGVFNREDAHYEDDPLIGVEDWFVPEGFEFEPERDDADDMVKVTKDQMVNRTCVKKVVLMVFNGCYQVNVEMKDGLIVRGKIYMKSNKALRKAGKLARKLGCGLIGRLP